MFFLPSAMEVRHEVTKLRKVESRTKDFNLFYAETEYLRQLVGRVTKSRAKHQKYLEKLEKQYPETNNIRYVTLQRKDFYL